MVEGRHFRVRDLDALWIGVAIEFAADFETGFRRGVGDQFDDDEEAEEWRRAPVLRDVAEHAMLDLVPLRSPWRIGANLNDQTGFVRELLEGQLPEPQPRTIGAAAVGRDHQAPHPGIELPTHLIEPASDGVDGELPGVVIDSEADIAEVGADVVDPDPIKNPSTGGPTSNPCRLARWRNCGAFSLGSNGEIVRDDARSSPPCRRRPWRRPRTY